MTDNIVKIYYELVKKGERTLESIKNKKIQEKVQELIAEDSETQEQSNE